MAVIKIERTVELTGPILTEGLNGTMFTTEGQAHEFTIHCTQGGTAVTLTGTVSAKFIREESNSTILIAGSLSNGAAVVTLPADCYHRSGRFSLTIFVTASSVVTCIYSATGSVKAAQAGTLLDTGSVVPDLDTLISMINGKVAKAGDTMTGRLYMRFSNGYSAISFLRPNGNNGVLVQATATNDSTSHMSFYQYSTDGVHFENYALPNTPVDLSTDAVYNILTTRAIQQGNASVSVSANSYADKTINFSPAFLTIPTVQLTINATTGGVTTALSLRAFVYSVSKTQLVIRGYNGTSTDLGFGVMWTAIST